MGKTALPHRSFTPSQPHSTVPTMCSRVSRIAMGRETETKKLAGTATSREVDRICTPMLRPWSIPANTEMPMQTSRLSTA